MKKMRLAQPVTITGRDVFGRSAWLAFTPTEMSGWYWRPDEGRSAALLPIDFRRVEYNKFLGFISLASQRSRFHIYEHLGVLRWSGLDGVIVEGSTWPPYHGRPLEVWEALAPHLVETTAPIKWIRPHKPAFWQYAGKRTGFVLIEPHEDAKREALDIKVNINYPGLGEKSVNFSFPSGNVRWTDMLKAKSPGWPARRYYPLLFASEFGWPHLSAFTWPQWLSPEDTLAQFVLHRVGDSAGILSLSHYDALPSAKVTSYCAGFEADLGVLPKVRFRPLSVLL